MSADEVDAIEAIRKALQALARALELSERVGYGSNVLGPLDDAQKATRYALDTVQGRT